MGKPPGVIGLEPDDAQHVDDALVTLVGVADPVDLQALGDALTHRAAGIERRERILEDDLHLLAQCLEIGAFGVGEIGALEGDVAVGGIEEPDEQAPQRRLPAPRLADEADRLTFPDVEGHVVDGANVGDGAAEHAALDGEVLDEVSNLDEVAHHRASSS